MTADETYPDVGQESDDQNDNHTTRRDALRLLGGGLALSSISVSARAAETDDLPEVLSETGDGETRLFATESIDHGSDEILVEGDGVTVGASEQVAIDVRLCERECLFLSIVGTSGEARVDMTATLSASEARRAADTLADLVAGRAGEEEYTVVERVFGGARTPLGDVSYIASEGDVGGVYGRGDRTMVVIHGPDDDDGHRRDGASLYLADDDTERLIGALRRGAAVIER